MPALCRASTSSPGRCQDVDGRDEPLAVFMRAPGQIAGDAGIEDAIALVGDEVDPAALHARIAPDREREFSLLHHAEPSALENTDMLSVMRGLVPGVHVFLPAVAGNKAWMAGTGPAMTGTASSTASGS